MENMLGNNYQNGQLCFEKKVQFDNLLIEDDKGIRKAMK